jgi:hypothetical protein
MPTKFKRNASDAGGTSRHRTHWQMPQIKQRLLFIYGGVSLVALLLIVHFTVARGQWFYRAQVIEGDATVTGKQTSAEDSLQPLYRVDLDIAVGEDSTLPAIVYTDLESWRVLEQGDRVRVTYQKNLARNHLRIQSMSHARD